jgi:hypothetical protein
MGALEAVLVLVCLALYVLAAWLLWYATADVRAQWRAFRQRAADKRALCSGFATPNELLRAGAVIPVTSQDWTSETEKAWRCVGCGMTWAERPRHADGRYADTWQTENCCGVCYRNAISELERNRRPLRNVPNPYKDPNP